MGTSLYIIVLFPYFGYTMKRKYFYQHKWSNHFKIKCLSLLCALILWLFIATDKYYEHTLNVSLNLINQPAEMVLKEHVPSNIKVDFGGSGKELINLGFSNKYIEIDLDQMGQTATFANGVWLLPDRMSLSERKEHHAAPCLLPHSG